MLEIRTSQNWVFILWLSSYNSGKIILGIKSGHIKIFLKHMKNALSNLTNHHILMKVLRMKTLFKAFIQQ